MEKEEEELKKLLRQFKLKKQQYELELGADIISEDDAYSNLIEYMLGLEFNKYFAFSIYKLNEDSSFLNYVNYDEELKPQELSIEKIIQLYFKGLIENKEGKKSAKLYSLALLLNEELIAKLNTELNAKLNSELNAELIAKLNEELIAELVAKEKNSYRGKLLSKIEQTIIDEGDAAYIYGYAKYIITANKDELGKAILSTGNIGYNLLFLISFGGRSKKVKNYIKKNLEQWLQQILDNFESLENNGILTKEQSERDKSKLENIANSLGIQLPETSAKQKKMI